MGRLYASDITVSIQRSRCWIAVETVLMAFAKFSDSDPVLSIDENDNSGSSVAALASVAVFNSTSCELMSLRSSSICLALVWTSGSSFCHTLWCLSKCSLALRASRSADVVGTRGSARKVAISVLSVSVTRLCSALWILRLISDALCAWIALVKRDSSELTCSWVVLKSVLCASITLPRSDFVASAIVANACLPT